MNDFADVQRDIAETIKLEQENVKRKVEKLERMKVIMIGRRKRVKSVIIQDHDKIFVCVGSGVFLPSEWKCDEEKDCDDGSDEVS